MDYVTVTLPHGSWRDRTCHREVELRPLTGSDEAFLLDEAGALLPAQRTTALLARCLRRPGPGGEVTADGVRSLTVGDREALVLHLRRLTLGERLQCIVDCRAPGCGARMDLALKVNDLLLPPYPDSRERYEITVHDGDASYRVRIRVPTGADAEAAAVLAREDRRRAEEELLRRSIEEVTLEGGQPVEDIPPAVAKTLPGTLAALDPQAETRLDLACPECQSGFSALLDAGTYLYLEIAAGMKQLYREVHLLAFHYHWSEAAIMGMTPRKRRRYLGPLSEALGAP